MVVTATFASPNQSKFLSHLFKIPMANILAVLVSYIVYLVDVFLLKCFAYRKIKLCIAYLNYMVNNFCTSVDF